MCLFPSVFIWAVIFGHHLRASVTLHRAAPVKLAVAATYYFDALLRHSEAAFVAQPAAALPLPLGHALVALQALPPFRAVKFQALVFHAVIGRILQINELRPRDATEGLRDGSPVVRAVPIPHGPLVHLQLLCVLVFPFQIVTDLPEVSKLHPAGLDAAAARHSVTLTRSSHGGFDRLYHNSESVKHCTGLWYFISCVIKQWKHVLPACPPRCCAGWPLRANHVRLRAHPQFLWRSFLQTPRYHYSHPRSILCHLHKWHIIMQFLKRAIPLISVETYLLVRFWSHRIRSCQSLPYCSSWWVYTSPRRRWWHGQTRSLLWLQEMSKTEKKTCYESCHGSSLRTVYAHLLCRNHRA